MKYALMISKYSKVSTWLIKANLMVGLVKISCCKICAAVESIKNFAKCWYLVCFLIGALIHFMKFLSLEITLYLYKSTIHPYMVYCCHIWAGAPSCYLELLDKLLKNMQDCWSFTCCFSWTLGDSLSKCGQLNFFL